MTAHEHTSYSDGSWRDADTGLVHVTGRESLRWLLTMRRDTLATFDRVRATFGTRTLFHLGRRRYLLTTDPIDVEHVLVAAGASMAKGSTLQRTRSVFGDGLLVSEGDVHLRQRRLAQPAFQPRRLEPYAEPIVRHTRRFVDLLAAADVVDLEVEMSRLTLDIAAETMFGTHLDDVEARDLADAMEIARNSFVDPVSTAAPFLDVLPLARNRTRRRAIATIKSLIDRIVRERQADPAAADRGDLLSLLLRARDGDGDGLGMTDERLRDECATLLLAGHETTANSLAWALWLLATHPDQLELVRAELRERCADRDPTVDDVGQLPHLRRVIAETLRMYPPGTALTRRVLETVELPSGVVAHPDWELIMPVTTMQREPEWFPEPDAFRPQRFLDGTPPSDWPRHVWVPFGGGRRVCIGQAFAMLEMELVIGVLARHLDFTVEPDQDITPIAAFTLRPAHGILATAATHTDG